MGVASVNAHHADVREALLCRACRNVVREAFYGQLKAWGFPFTQPAATDTERGAFGPLLLAAMGRGVLETDAWLRGDEVEAKTRLVIVGRDLAEVRDLLTNEVYSGVITWR